MRARRGRLALAAVAAASAFAARGAEAEAGAPGEVLRLEVGAVYFGRMCSTMTGCDWSAVPGGAGGTGAAAFGATFDSPIGATANLSAGGRLMWRVELHQFELEPVFGVTWKLPASRSLEVRLHAGGGVYLGAVDGIVLRLGAGLGVRLAPALDLGLDVFLEPGLIEGKSAMASSVALGPAFRL